MTPHSDPEAQGQVLGLRPHRRLSAVRELRLNTFIQWKL